MSLRSEFERQGLFLFRYRSFLPLVTVPLFILAFHSYRYIVGNEALNELWAVGCLVVSFLGLTVRIVTVGYAPSGTSGRNAVRQVADSLTTTGMYSLVRHPLYLGNFLIWLGITLFFHSWWFVLLMTCLFILYYERIMFTEESFLRVSFGDAFETWAAGTPSFIPWNSRWRNPGLSFSWRSVLRREYPGFTGILIAFTTMEFIGDSLIERDLSVEPSGLILLTVGITTFIALRTLKKKTSLLHVEGR